MKEKDKIISNNVFNEDGRVLGQNGQGFADRITNLLSRLHEYLPEDFPKYEIVNDKKGIYKALIVGDVYVKISHEGEIIPKVAPTLISEFKFETFILFHFLNTYSKDQNVEFVIAGLPWRFNLRGFVEKYSPKVQRAQMRDLLNILGTNKDTIEKYLSDFGELFLVSEFEEFQEKFRTLGKGAKNNATFPFDKYLPILGVTEDQVMEWHSEGLLEKDIRILPQERVLIYFR